MVPIVIPNDLSSVEIKHLHALRAVVEEGSFGAAATRLGYTQSAVSQQIAALERAVGTSLFDRPGGPRKVRLTRAGELLDVHAVAILARVAAAGADLAAYADGDAGRVNIGTFQSIAVQALPLIVGRLRTEAPGLRVELTEHEESEVLADALVAGDLDVSFLVAIPTERRGLEVVGSWTDPFLVMSPVGEPLVAAGRAVPVDALDGPPMVAQRANSCQALLERNLAGVGVAPDVIFRTGDNSAVQAMVRAGGCHAVMPRLTIDLDDPGISVHPVTPELPARTISLAVATGRARSPAVDRVIEHATVICDELLNPAT
ncbi:MAG: LysR family transcriptional regulator [Actinomycetota bacterium]|nr:LysR family transcriptional regulator [Actinomycetota bacterium]